MSKIKLSKLGGKPRVGTSFEGFNRETLSPRAKKLLKEWMKIDNLSHNSDVIKYIIRKRNREGLPLEFEVIYHLNSIVGVKESPMNGNDDNRDKSNNSREPIYGNEHRLSIALPNNYPSAFGGNPEFKMITDTWHPNIRSSGKFKGRICLNNKDLGVSVGLDERILRVGKYLQYQIYWANETYPWPEDKSVAEWVRDEAEPNKWVNMSEGIFSDYSALHKNERVIKRDKSEKKAGRTFDENSNDDNLTK